MNLTGTCQLKAARERVWDALNDPEILRRCTPGCKEFAPTGENSYAVLLEVGVGSVKGRYKGKIEITNRVPGREYRLAVQGTGNTGFVNADGVIQLNQEGDETRIEYSGQARVGGPIAGVGQRVMEGAAKFLVGQFFKCFEAAILRNPAGAESGFNPDGAKSSGD